MNKPVKKEKSDEDRKRDQKLDLLAMVAVEGHKLIRGKPPFITKYEKVLS